jgi:nucleoside-diphosphate-sugar epimerase
VFLVFGRTGWIGGLVGDLLKQQGAKFEYATARLEDRAAVLADIERVKPTHVLNAAGLTGRPNVDWCETHRVETIRANVIGCLTLADVTNSLGIHMTYFVSLAPRVVPPPSAGAQCARAFGPGKDKTHPPAHKLTNPPPKPKPHQTTTQGTGCIFHYTPDGKFAQGSGHGFEEADEPNFTGSYYSKTKAMVETMLREYPNVLTLRVRMPIVGDLTYARNFITKVRRLFAWTAFCRARARRGAAALAPRAPLTPPPLTPKQQRDPPQIIKYDKVIDIPNSMTVLPELLPMAIDMVRHLGHQFGPRAPPPCGEEATADAPDDDALTTHHPPPTHPKKTKTGQAQPHGRHELHQPGRHQPQRDPPALQGLR